tara:strand:- start:1169 stop:1558 length:390 start_codon:yes stop_codon:yes gene_type:complete
MTLQLSTKKSYVATVQCFGLITKRRVLLHGHESDLEEWIDEDFEKRQEKIDEKFQAEYQYDVHLGDMTIEAVHNALIGDDMGFKGQVFKGQVDDYKCRIIRVLTIDEIDPLGLATKTVWEVTDDYPFDE